MAVTFADRAISNISHMKHFLISILIVCSTCTASAQFYYNDVLLTRKSERQIAQYKQLGIKSVMLRSIESNNPADENFRVEQTFNNNYSEAITISTSSISGPSELISRYNENGKLISSSDTSDGFRSTTMYSYTPGNRIDSIKNTAYSPGGVIDEEVHQWIYNEEGAPVKLYKIKNNTDTTVVEFILDEEGRIGEEKAIRNGRQLPVIYYYYDSEDRLTDIVRYNEKARRLLPDLIFEYDNNNRMKSMMVIPEGSDDYQLWVYSYDDQGLKTRETCFNKDKRQLGYVQYEYKR